MKYLRKLSALLCLLLSVSVLSHAQTPKGHLVIIGGGGRTEAIDQALVSLSGGADARMLVISTAGANPAKDGEKFIKEIKKAGIKKLAWIAPTRAESENPDYVKKALEGVGGVFFTGGQQSRIIDTLRGTLLHRQLYRLYEEGGMIGGTSAGAAMMSEVMITGGRTDHSDEGFKSISRNIVRCTEGMGFIQGVIIDQHFLKRSRENRLFSIAFDYPEVVCIGIDEATSIVVSNGADLEVVGRSSVMVIEPDPASVKVSARGDYGGQARVLLLFEGDRYHVK